jgi:hypothetical protein
MSGQTLELLTVFVLFSGSRKDEVNPGDPGRVQEFTSQNTE